MKWKKLGLLYQPRDVHPKLMTHAANTLPILLAGDVYRIFYNGRDEKNRSSVGFVDIDIVKREIVFINPQPIFEPGSTESYYPYGVSIGSSYQIAGQRYILFMGWQMPDDGHWRGEIGRFRLAQDMSSAFIDGERPLLGFDSTDPISLSYPFVLEDDGFYRMWYGSTITWDAGNDEMLHMIYAASSDDGHQWRKSGRAVPCIMGVAQAFSRPSVIHDAAGYHMWFSYRGNVPERKYRIGYAFSADGCSWELRLDQVGIDVSAEGWDSEMIEYPFVFDHRGLRYMLYNGNGYGKTGFGIAVLE